MGFQTRKQERLELFGLIFKSIIVYNLLLTLNKLGFQPCKRETRALWTNISVYHS